MTHQHNRLVRLATHHLNKFNLKNKYYDYFMLFTQYILDNTIHLLTTNHNKFRTPDLRSVSKLRDLHADLAALVISMSIEPVSRDQS